MSCAFLFLVLTVLVVIRVQLRTIGHPTVQAILVT
jgi:hypothetical protein